MYLGIDLGSSSIKLALFDSVKNKIIASATYPKVEMKIHAPKPDWAEQNPEEWWSNFLHAYNEVFEKAGSIKKSDVKAFGISYQMHGLVLVDENLQVLRPAIIWSDSRAVEMGDRIYRALGETYSQSHLLNSPGNFTASKLAWVKENEPDVYAKIYKFMLPGDYIAMRLSKKVTTTETGLSEGVFWDFENREINKKLIDILGIDTSIIPDIVPAIGADISIDPNMAAQLGLNKDAKLTYRSGDQPNNAFSLNVLQPGEAAATAGTSGVIYAVTDKNIYDKKSRINTFLHITDTPEAPRNGILIIVNGTGILYSWLKKLLNTPQSDFSYIEMNRLAEQAPEGADGVLFYPFGNGAERILENKLIGASLFNIDFNRHSSANVVRAGLEGIVYALNYGFDMLDEMDISIKKIRVGYSNLFLSKTFREIFTNVTGVTLELYDTDGSAGTARGAALGYGGYKTTDEAFKGLECLEIIYPDREKAAIYKKLYNNWKDRLEEIIRDKKSIPLQETF